MRRGWRSPRSVGPVCRRRRSPSVSGRPEAGSRPFTRWRRLVCLAAFQRESRLQGGEKKSDERSAAAQLLPPCPWERARHAPARGASAGLILSRPLFGNFWKRGLEKDHQKEVETTDDF